MSSGDEFETDATPDVDQLQQLPSDFPSVPVRIEGQVLVHELPARGGPAYAEALTNTSFTKVLFSNPKRKVATLLCRADWLYSHSGLSGTGVPWPADVPLILGHRDEVYAMTETEPTGRLTVIPEIFAD